MTVARRLVEDAVLRVGEVTEVSGRRVFVTVDRNKNSAHLFLDGDLVTNISVNSFISIRKGFNQLIGRVEGEKVEEATAKQGRANRADRTVRVLMISLIGSVDKDGEFTGGTKELPLIGNEPFIVPSSLIEKVHSFGKPEDIKIRVATLYGDGFELEFPVNGLFNSHIAIFGNTGSGKSNTLAILYQSVIEELFKSDEEYFREHNHFLFFDFNGEYSRPNCLSSTKKVFRLSTRGGPAEKLPVSLPTLLDAEFLSVICDATEKTQRPFLARAVRLYMRTSEEGIDYIRNVSKKYLKEALQLSDKEKAVQVLEHFRMILPPEVDDLELERDVLDELEWHNGQKMFMWNSPGGRVYLQEAPDRIDETPVFRRIEQFELDGDVIGGLIRIAYVQLVIDILAGRAQQDHVAPVLNRLVKRQGDIRRVFEINDVGIFDDNNVVVVNLNNVNLEMKKTVPLLLAKLVYSQHKEGAHADKTLSLVIDEAHNILSTSSFREAESWKDYRLETFEEIIKEGRKFGVFVTIASQRPNDISPTITSQAHNYFIHRLINQKDLQTIASAVSYIDKVSEESIPTLPVGTCVFSGVTSQMPIKIEVYPLPEDRRPKSETRPMARHLEFDHHDG